MNLRRIAAILILLSAALPVPGKSIVVYFSEDDAVERVAAYVSHQLSAETFRVEPKEPYSRVMEERERRIAMEKAEDLRPEIAVMLTEDTEYDAVVLVMPLWLDTVPQAMATFLSSRDFSGKRMAPIVLDSNLSAGQSVERIEELCPNVDVSECLAIDGSTKWQDAVDSWIKHMEGL